MSVTTTRCRPFESKPIDFTWEAPVKPKDEGPGLFVPEEILNDPQALLALLCADPPTATSTVEEPEKDVDDANSAEQTAEGKKDPGMERIQGIVALKDQLADLGLNGDDELFKTSYMNVGKYVIGPVVSTSQSVDDNAEAALGDRNEYVTEAGEDVFAASDDSVNTATNAPVGGDAKLSTNDNMGDDILVKTLVSLEIEDDEVIDTRENSHEIRVDDDAVDDDYLRRVPPTTPADNELIWWENEFFVVKKSVLGGLGAFAAKDLEAGQTILEELPLLTTNNWGLNNEVDSLSEEDKELFFSLHKFSAQPETHMIEKIRRANSFKLPHGVAIYSVTSRFNHACLPVRSVHYDIDGQQAKITLSTVVPVSKGTELTICYGGSPEQLLRGFGFRCQCGGCTPLTDQEADDIIGTFKGKACWSNWW